MPVPILLAGLAVAAGALGAGGHLSAKETNERAQTVSKNAQELYDNAKRDLEIEQKKTEKALVKLGYDKKNVLDTSMNSFITTFDKIKHIQLKESVGVQEIAKFTIDQQEVLAVSEMTDIYSSSFASGVTGVAAGAAVALAASGALPIVTGELALAGSALAAGEFGMAAGFAGSALSFGAAMTPLAAVAAPVILFTGISASIKADENLEKANTMYAEAKAASEKMKISETLCSAITEKSEMFDDLLRNLNKMFAECSDLLADVVRKKEKTVFKKKITSDDFDDIDLELIATTRALAGAVKSVIDMPILSKDGNISYEAEDFYEQTVEKLPDFRRAVQKVESANYNVKSVATKNTNETYSAEGINAGGTTIMSGARRVFAVVMGFIIASVFSEDIALRLNGTANKFCFLDSFIANKIAIWLLLCISVIMLIGNFKNDRFKKICGLGANLSLVVLYVQYCRSVEAMGHYLIFSIVFLILSTVIFGFFDAQKDNWNCSLFFSCEFFAMMLWPIGFIIYAFLSKLIGFSDNFCLVGTTILFSIISVLGTVRLVKDSNQSGSHIREWLMEKKHIVIGVLLGVAYFSISLYMSNDGEDNIPRVDGSLVSAKDLVINYDDSEKLINDNNELGDIGNGIEVKAADDKQNSNLIEEFKADTQDMSEDSHQLDIVEMNEDVRQDIVEESSVLEDEKEDETSSKNLLDNGNSQDDMFEQVGPIEFTLGEVFIRRGQSIILPVDYEGNERKLDWFIGSNCRIDYTETSNYFVTVKGINCGVTELEAEDQYLNTADIDITVYDLYFDSSQLSLVEGEKEKIEYKCEGCDASELDIEIGVSNSNIGYINNKGFFVAESQGETQIFLMIDDEIVDSMLVQVECDEIESEFIFEDSNSRYLTKKEVKGLSDWELRIARNEIYARHGRKFASADLKEYFSACTWYKGKYSPEEFDSIVSLNDYERKNAQLIKEIEDSRK